MNPSRILERWSRRRQLAALPRRTRWAVPAGTALAVGGLLAAPTLLPAQAAPTLPARTPTQLLAAVTADLATPPPLSGTITETAALGLTALPTPQGTLSLPALLGGAHTINLWYADPAHYRVALPQPASEGDIIRSGDNLWVWDSSSDTATDITLPAATGQGGPALPLTPQQSAQQVLAAVGPTTTVGVDPDVRVAGRAAYELVLHPKSARSLIGQVRIAIDARRDIPLRVQVFARDARQPALQVGFTAVSFHHPGRSNFAFTPPPRATVTRTHLASPASVLGAAAGNQPEAGATVVGSGWLTVVELPESSLQPAGGHSQATSPRAGSLPFTHTSSQAAPAGTPTNAATTALGLGGGILPALLQAAEPVHGPWGHGRLLRTGLLSVLATSNGKILIGAVTPEVVYRAVTKAGHPPTLQQHAAKGRQ